MNRAGLFAVAALALVAGTGVVLAQAQAPAPTPVAPTAPPAAAAAPTAPLGDTVVAIVNGEKILADEILYLYQTLGEGVRTMSFELLYPQLVQSSIERTLAAQKARLAKMQDRDDVKRRSEFWAERVLEETLLNETVEKGVTPEVLQKKYQALIANEAGQEEISLKHMLFREPDGALAAIRELDAGGNFDVILDRVTKAQTGEGGPIDYFRRGEILPAFSDAAFKMRAGEYTTTPVRTEFGWHIIMIVDRRSAAPPKLEEVIEELRGELGRQLVEEFYTGLTEGAQVQKFNLDGTPANF